MWKVMPWTCVQASPWRGSGVAIPVFSIRSEESVGSGEFLDLNLMIDLASKTGMRLVQLLPVNDTSVNMMWWDSYPYRYEHLSINHFGSVLLVASFSLFHLVLTKTRMTHYLKTLSGNKASYLENQIIIPGACLGWDQVLEGDLTDPMLCTVLCQCLHCIHCTCGSKHFQTTFQVISRSVQTILLLLKYFRILAS